MKKILIMVGGAGSAVLAGSVGFLIFRGVDALSVELWIFAAQGLANAPKVVIDEALHGTRSLELMAFLAGVVGSGVVVVAACVGAVVMGGEAVRVSTRRFRTASLKVDVPASKKSEDPRSKPARQEAPKKPRPKVRIKMPERRKSLDEARLARLLKGVIAHLAFALKKLKRGGRKTVVLNGGADTGSVLEVAPKDQDFLLDLRDWHRSIKQGGGGEEDVAERARELSARATPAVIARVHEDDPMGGEYLLRMLRAWSERSSTPLPRPTAKAPGAEDPEASMMTAAIEDVISRGVVTDGDEGEAELDLDEGGEFLPGADFASLTKPEEDHDVDLDEDDDDVGDMAWPGLADDANSQAPIKAESDNEAREADASAEGLGSALLALMNLRNLAESVRDGEAEWPEDLQDQDVRVAQLEEAFITIEELLSAVDSTQVDAWIKEHEDDRQWAWFGEERDRFDDERTAILDLLVEDQGDEEEAFSMVPRSDAESDDEPSSDGVEQAEEEVVSETIDGAHEDANEGVELVPARVEDAPEDDGEAEDGAGGVLEVDGPQSSDEPDNADGRTDGHFESGDPKVEPTEGRNLSLNELDEVEKSDELLVAWAFAAKEAGASEARLASTIVKSRGGRRQVIGVIHMLAAWRGSDGKESNRLNLIFRYVPEGEWRLDHSDGIRMVDERGNHVGVKSIVFDQPEISGKPTVVHFYGPGAPREMAEQTSEGVHVVSRVFSSSEIKTAVFG